MNVLLAIHLSVFVSAVHRDSFSTYPFAGVKDKVNHGISRRTRTKIPELEHRKRDSKESILSQPSPCVWAILACCAPPNLHYRFGCFPYLGCSPLFWKTDPCLLETVLHAARDAVKFYQQFDEPPVSLTPTDVTSAKNDTFFENTTTRPTTTASGFETTEVVTEASMSSAES